MSQTLTLDIYKGAWITSNGRYHWADRARRTRTIRTLARFCAVHQHLRPTAGLVRITATIHGRTAGRVDPANAYPTIKACVDGMTDAGCWPDDDQTHVIGPDMRAGEPIKTLKPGWHRVVITIEDIS